MALLSVGIFMSASIGLSHGAQVDAFWSTGTANWNTAGNWTPAVIPNNGTGGNTYHVKIDNGSGTNAIVNMNLSPTIDLLTVSAGDTLNLNNVMDLRVEIGPIVNDGLISINGSNSATELLLGTSMSLTGAGILQLSNSANSRIYGVTGGPAQHLNHAATHTIRGGGAVGVNLLTLTNNGLIEASNASTMALDLAAGANVNAGTIQAVGTGVLNINDSAIDNSTGMLKALGTSTVNLTSSSITGGQIMTDAGAAISGNLSSLKNITLSGTVRHDNGEDLVYEGTITNNGAIQLNSANINTEIQVHANGVTFTGSGAIQGNNDTFNYINDTGAPTPPLCVNAATHTIRGSMSLGNNRVNLTNQGLIDANQAVPINLDLAAGLNTNTGIIQASAAGTLNINDTVLDNTVGAVKALGTSTVNISNSTIDGGQLQADPGAAFSANASVLKNVSLSGLLRQDNLDTVGVVGLITNNGTIQLNGLNIATDIQVQANGVTFDGSGVIEGNIDPDVVNIITDNAAVTPPVFTNSATHTIRGGIRVGNNRILLNNQGLIDATIATAPLTIDLAAGANVNTGTIRASGTGVLNINDTLLTNSAGVIKALDTSTVNITNSTIDGGQLEAAAGAAFSGMASTLKNITLTGLYRQDNIEDNTFEGTITNNGTIQLNGINSATDVIIPTAGTTFSGSGQIVMSSNNSNRILAAAAPAPDLTNAPTHTIRGSGQMGNNSLHIINQGFIIADQAVALTIDPDNALGLQNSGTLSVTGTGGMTIAAGNFTTSGNVNIAATRQLSRSGAYLQTAGTTTVNGTLTGASSVQIGGGTLNGGGVVATGVINLGTIAPGDAIGVLSISNGLTETANGIISIEVGGLASGTQYDVLQVTGGGIALDGILKVRFVNGFDPQIGDVFTVMTYPNTPLPTLGVFSSLDVPCNLPGRRVQVTITTTAVTVEIVAATTVVDINCDCVFTPQIDIPAFITAVLDPAAFALNYPTCPITNADFNADTLINGRDVQGFVSAIVGP